MHKERYNIFEHSENSKLLADMIIEIICVQVLKDDIFPKTVCSNCLGKLNEAYSFKMLAVESDLKLQNFCQNKCVHNEQENENNLNIAVKANDAGRNTLLDRTHVQQYFSIINALSKQNGDCAVSMKSSLTIEDWDHIDGDPLKEMTETNKNEEPESDLVNVADDVSSDISSESSDSEAGSSSAEDEILDGKSDKNDNVAQDSSAELPRAQILEKQPLTKQLTRKEKLSKRFYCKLCNKMFSYHYYYLVHVKEHNGNTPHKCDVCGKSFVIKCMLTQHKQSHLTNKQFSCDVCGKNFKLMNGLKTHQVVHSEDRPFKCDVCDKSFKLESVLKTHTLRHNNIRRHVCEMCGKAFIDRSGLLKHKATHNIGKNFTCSVCGKDYKTKACLDRHLKMVHSGIKSHACDQCDRRFSDGALLRQHILIHTGDKPFACEICGKTFRQRSCIPRHMRIHTVPSPLKEIMAAATANLRLKSNILDLVCRICLKMHKERYNIFEHSENSRLPANMIMELMCIQVLKDDSFPKTICKNCLGKLNEAYNLKILALESNIKLLNFCRSKTVGNDSDEEKSLNVALDVKEEPTDVKLENITEEVHLKTARKENEKKSTSAEENSAEINEVDKENDTQVATAKNVSVKDSDSLGETTLSEDATKTDENEKQGSDSSNDLNTDNVSSDISSESSDTESESSSSENETPHNPGLPHEKVELPKRKRRLVRSSVRGKIFDSQQFTKPLSRKGKFRCKICDKSFSYNYYLVHIRQHAGNAPHKCDVCGKHFVLKSILKQHKQSHATDKRFSCDVCGKTFKILAGLKMHQFVHSENRPFKCDVCGKLFKQETSLRIHTLRHKNIRRHVCEICGKAFIDRSGLRKHKETHNDEKSFTCSVCGKGFKSKVNLDCHQKVHTGIKSHACNQCDKRFGGSEQLKQHLRIHTGAKPFACEICGKTFRQRSCLPRHMRIHTGETPFPCKICTSTFKFSHHLQNHMKVHHKDVPQE
ncbi:hypothetical protein Trydic_g23427 [Trypoxylus dichotomus]